MKSGLNYDSLSHDCRVIQPFILQFMEQGYSASDALLLTQRTLAKICEFPWEDLTIDEDGMVKPKKKRDSA